VSGPLEATARLVGPSVVEIFTTTYAPGGSVVPRTADLVTTQRASGSGVIVDPDGYIVTNAHVVRGAQRLRVELSVPSSGQSILATRSRTVSGLIVGIDRETDLAVIKVAERNLPALAFGDSDELKAAQVVLAFGSPLGLHNSVSLGVVSAVARQLEPESPMVYVQTDATINRGSTAALRSTLRAGPAWESGRLCGTDTRGSGAHARRQADGERPAIHVSLYRRPVGDVVTLEVLRDKRSLEVSVTMAERQDSLASLSSSIDQRQNLVPRLGILG
jgi:S1-C subfamily serine protease